MEEVKRDRARRKLLRVTFPNGKVLCYKSTTDTMIATMQELGDGVIANHCCPVKIRGMWFNLLITN